MHDVIVVGGGIGGCGVAALLARKGLDVVLIEKNKTVGGKCTSIDRDGFRIPTYIHMMARADRGPCAELAREIGELLEWVRLGDGILNLMGQELSFKGGGIATSVLKYLRAFNFSLRDILGLVGLIIDGKRSDEKVEKKFDGLDMETWISRRLRNRTLNAVMAYVNAATFCIPYSEASAAEFNFIEKGIREAGAPLGYPVGECGAIPDTYLQGFLLSLIHI